jgi:hypothetical protein
VLQQIVIDLGLGRASVSKVPKIVKIFRDVIHYTLKFSLGSPYFFAGTSTSRLKKKEICPPF